MSTLTKRSEKGLLTPDMPWNRDPANAAAPEPCDEIGRREVGRVGQNPRPHPIGNNRRQSGLPNISLYTKIFRLGWKLSAPTKGVFPLPAAAEPCVVGIAPADPSCRRRIHERNHD